MTSSSNIVKTINPITDDFFLCRSFAKAISSDKLLQIIEQQPAPIIEVDISPNEVEENCSIPPENLTWKVGDLCLCPYTEDGLLYKATILNIDSSSCTVLFDDYGNEESHLLTDLQIRTEDEQQQEPVSIDDEQDTLTSVPQPPAPLLPPFPELNSNDNNDTLSSTLMSWYLAGYHTGFYQGIKDKK
ncbi:unnamed protein product [Adineta steineri]|uniref:Tudor domain-containing protein n=1 Tax=Adineta steineri TaxID=433720 RepID=A0A814N9E1_9BILA|nr:unnamed protein product [Adineta steineri]CAF4003357.1 unnamed protein product [Adineta steineri]